MFHLQMPQFRTQSLLFSSSPQQQLNTAVKEDMKAIVIGSSPTANVGSAVSTLAPFQGLLLPPNQKSPMPESRHFYQYIQISPNNPTAIERKSDLPGSSLSSGQNILLSPGDRLDIGKTHLQLPATK